MKEGTSCKSRDIKRIIKEYYKQSYANNFDNSGEMGRFLETHKSPGLTQKEIEGLPWGRSG